jgi:hypothetical protein
MRGELPGFDDIDGLRTQYIKSYHKGLRRQILRTVEQKLDDLLAFSEKNALAGYDMPTWRLKLTVPFDAEFNVLITGYTRAIEAAQGKVFNRAAFNDELKLSGRRSPPVHKPWES